MSNSSNNEGYNANNEKQKNEGNNNERNNNEEEKKKLIELRKKGNNGNNNNELNETSSANDNKIADIILAMFQIQATLRVSHFLSEKKVSSLNHLIIIPFYSSALLV